MLTAAKGGELCSTGSAAAVEHGGAKGSEACGARCATTIEMLPPEAMEYAAQGSRRGTHSRRQGSMADHRHRRYTVIYAAIQR